MHRFAPFAVVPALFLASCSAPTDVEGTESSQASIAGGAFCPAAAPVSQWYSGSHDGVDIAAAYGAPIYAVAAGVVTDSGPAQGYGQWIRIRHDDGSMTEYGHMSRRDVGAGVRVDGGQRIALVGAEGQATGPHLHLRTYARAGDAHGIDPATYLRARGVSLPCSAGAGSGSAPPPGGNANCGVSGGKLTCANTGNTPMHQNPWAGSPVVDTLRTTRSWFSCWFSGEPHAGGNSIWYWTQGDDRGNWGFVPAVAVETTVDPAPGLVHCGD